MEIQTPVWSASESTYTFDIQLPSETTEFILQGEPVFLDSTTDFSKIQLPVIPDSFLTLFVQEFIEKTKKWFTRTLEETTVKKRLRHALSAVVNHHEVGWFTPLWKPLSLRASKQQFTLVWTMPQWEVSTPKISADFLMESTTPRVQSPQPQSPQLQSPEQELRTIQIQDTLIPVGDLPLSDLPPLSFLHESTGGDVYRQEIRQKIREARLRVALAKLKAQRMEQRYYERYGEAPVDSEDSSELSSEIDSGEEAMER